MKIKKQLVIGLGTGRCGTVSLSHFLSYHEGIDILHEGLLDTKSKRNPFKWKNDEENVITWLKFLEKNDKANWFGDIGMYFLNYVDIILEKYPTTKFIVLKREKELVVNSFLKKTEGRNHWYTHKGKKWRLDPKWDDCFPKYPYEDKRKALNAYWEDYYKQIDVLIEQHPSCIRLWKTEELNTENGKLEILDFIDFEGNMELQKPFQDNKTNPMIFFVKRMWSWVRTM